MPLFPHLPYFLPAERLEKINTIFFIVKKQECHLERNSHNKTSNVFVYLYVITAHNKAY